MATTLNSASPAVPQGRLSAITCATAVLLCALAHAAQAQVNPADAPTLRAVTVSSHTAPASSVTGFGDEELQRTPLSVTSLGADTLAASQVRRVSDLIQLDGSATDAYNAIGYWDYVTIRGFVLDQNYNYRRDGLPISAETTLGLENRENVELLKGTSGVQAGTSSPGGLVNHVIKRPTAQPLRTVRVQANQYGDVLAHVDLGGRFGVDDALGYRVNVAAENLRNHVAGAGGTRTLAALAMDWRLQPGSLLEVELEHTRRRQPGVPGLSLTGSTLPKADPFININRQPWSRPGVMEGLTGSVRYEQAINADWSWSAHLASQRLKADDFLAYPYGCYDGKSDTYYADRYCPNGDFDLYDYRSLDERRNTHAAQWQVKGKVGSAYGTHNLTAGVMKTLQTERGHPQADNNDAVGTGNLYTLPSLPENATFADPYTNRTERSTEWFAYDRLQWNSQLSTWVGLRHSRIERDSIRTDGSRATHYTQGFTTPWLAMSYQLHPGTMLYASTGQGVESTVAPGRSRYTNAGQSLQPLKSRQWELGLKAASEKGQIGVAVFNIVRPLWGDAGTCSTAGTCTRTPDGEAQHQGLELNGVRRLGPATLHASAMWLHAKRRNSTIDPSLNGQRPTNVPAVVLRAGVNYAVAQVPGLSLSANVSHEGRRNVLPDGSVQLPAWTRLDAGVAYDTRLGAHKATWRVGIQNLVNKRYFQEAPYQYSHVYLFPAAPRTVTVSLDSSF